MTDDGDGRKRTALLEVHGRVGTEVVNHAAIEGIGKREGTTGMGIVAAPCLATYSAGGKVVHAGLHTLIAQIIV